MKAVVAAFNQEKAVIGAFSVITNLRMDLRLKHYYWTSGKKFIPLFVATYLRRLRREKKLRRGLEQQLERETKKRSYFESAINQLQNQSN